MICKAISKQSGKRCTKVATHDGFCALHDPARAKERSRLAIQGARKRHRPSKRRKYQPRQYPANGRAESLAEASVQMANAFRTLIRSELKAIFSEER